MTSKTLRYLAVTYLVFYLVAIAIERHGFERGPMSPIDRILTALIRWGFALYGVWRGSVMGRISWVDRSEQPFAFWFIVTFGFLCGFFYFAGAYVTLFNEQSSSAIAIGRHCLHRPLFAATRLWEHEIRARERSPARSDKLALSPDRCLITG